MQFLKKKSEQGVGQSGKSASQNSLRRDASPRYQANGDALSSHDKAYYLRKASLDSQVSARMSYVYIDSSEAELSELSNESEQQPQRISQLSKTLDHVLRDKDALPSFIQYMDSIGSVNLVKFWLDADTFRSTSLARLNLETISQSADGTRSGENLPESATSRAADRNLSLSEKTEDVVPDRSDSATAGRRSHPGSVTAHGDERFARKSSPYSPTLLPKIACESATLVSSGTSGRHDNVQTDVPRSSLSCIPANAQEVDANVVRPSENSPVHLPQYSTGVNVVPSRNDLTAPCLQQLPTANLSRLSEGDAPAGDRDMPQTISKTIENDAAVIFAKYLSPDSLDAIGVSDDLRKRTLSRICNNEGTVDPLCFDHCQQYVFDLMETHCYSQFLQSVFYIKHQIDILSQLLLADILYNDTALSYFTEFMEEQKAITLLQCFLDLDNFHRHLLSQGVDYNADEAQNDAMIIYDKYISMQATQSVRFGDKVRLKVETNICRESGLLPDCFRVPCQLVLRHMEKVHYPQFLKSEMYTKYVTDLLNASHLMRDPVEFRKKRIESDTVSEKSAGSQGAGGNESSGSKNTYLARDTSGRHFAKAMNRFGDNMRIDSSLFNPDSLWHRPNAGRMKFGKVTELGQFVSDLDPDPDHNKKKLAPFFTVTKKREREKSEEDMAWQVAQQIVSDVMTETRSDEPTTSLVVASDTKVT